MKELVKIDNVWVKRKEAPKLLNWKREIQKAKIAREMAVRAEATLDILLGLEPKVKEEKELDTDIKRCKSYDEIEKAFSGDEPRPEEYKLPRKWQDKVALGENLKEMRSLLGWSLYQEWVKETITEG